MGYPQTYNPVLNRDFLLATGLMPFGADSEPGEVWQTAHLLTTTVASYCSEHRIHPAWVCAWFGARQPSECYSEAAMLGSMALVEAWKSREGKS